MYKLFAFLVLVAVLGFEITEGIVRTLWFQKHLLTPYFLQPSSVHIHSEHLITRTATSIGNVFTAEVKFGKIKLVVKNSFNKIYMIY